MENSKNRIIWDECTPTRDRRPTEVEDIEEDIHVYDYGSELDVVVALLDLYHIDMSDEEIASRPYSEIIEDVLEEFNSDPGDGSINVMSVTLGGTEIYFNGYDCMDVLDLTTITERELKDVIIDQLKEDGDIEEDWCEVEDCDDKVEEGYVEPLNESLSISDALKALKEEE